MSLKGGETQSDAVDMVLSAYFGFGLSSFCCHMSLNDDSESNVLEGIQNSELLADLRETS